MKIRSFPARIRDNILSSSYGRNEFSGAWGDMGTFIPLTAALIAVTGLDACSVLFFAGLFNITTGLLFGIPMCVQPMKAIAAIAITEGLSPADIYGAGALVGGVFLLVGIAGLAERIDRLLPASVVRGLQLGIGLNLMIRGFYFVVQTGRAFGHDSITMGVAASLLIFPFFFSKRFPSALVVFVLGIVIATLWEPAARQGRLGFALPDFLPPGADALGRGAFGAAVAQLPLTLLNSVIAVCALSHKLFPDRPAQTNAVSTSVGVMNVVGSFFGAMPMCHGAGGLAGQYRFGARTAGSMTILGTVKLALALFASGAVTSYMIHYPRSILGVLLIVSGMELAILIRDQKERTPMLIGLLTAAGIVALGTLEGFLVGLAVAYAVYKGVFRLEKTYDRHDIIGVYEEERENEGEES